MNRTERTIVYSALSLLSAVVLLLVLSSSGRSALADSVSFIADVLGPAEAVKLTDGAKEVELRAKAGRVTWGTGDFKQTYSVAFVDITKVMNPLMEAEGLVEERAALVKELEEKDAEYRERLDAFGEQLQGADQNDPNAQQKLAEARALYEEYQGWGREAIQRRDQLDVRQLESAYRELAAAVDVVAGKLGVDIVLRFLPTATEFQASNAEEALTEIRLRTAVKYPEALDITNEVLEELSIQPEE